MPVNYDTFIDEFNTPLPPETERRFQLWLQEMSQKMGRDLSMDIGTYDMRGFWLEGLEQGSDGHFVDKYKKPNHPTFSNESIYNGAKSKSGETWFGGKWGQNKKGEYDKFYVNPKMLKNMDRSYIEDYLKRSGPGIKPVYEWSDDAN